MYIHAVILSQLLMLDGREFFTPCVIFRLQELPLADPKEDEVEVKYMASPINPADINILQGVCVCPVLLMHLVCAFLSFNHL